MSLIYFILGQTATGKTAHATELAKTVGGELINCDSRQIYKHLSVVTGKSDNPKDVPVHLIDFLDPSERFTSFDFARTAYNIIQSILQRGNVPIVVGGSGLYAYTLLYYSPSKSSRFNESPESKEMLRLANLDKAALQKELKKLNEDAYSALNESDRQNPRRLVTKINHLVHGGREIIQKQATDTIHNLLPPEITLFLYQDIDRLHTNIEARVRERLENGALAEARRLQEMRYTKESPGLHTLGYPSLYRHLEGMTTENELISEWTTKERQYAKRQKTYLLKYFPQAKVHYI